MTYKENKIYYQTLTEGFMPETLKLLKERKCE